MKYIDFNEMLKEDLKDPAFKKEWDALDAEFAPIHAAIRKQIRNDLIKAGLAKKMRFNKRLVTVLS